MIIMKILGGFASQLKHYSVGVAIANSLSTELVFDLSDYENGYFRPYVLEYLSIPKYRILSEFHEKPKAKVVRDGESLIRAYEERRNNIHIIGEIMEFKAFFDKYPTLFTNRNSEVFKTIRLRNESVFVSDFDEEIKDSYSIGVHVRLGDFVSIGWNDSIDEYKASLGHLLSINPKAKVFFFSNDISSLEKLFGSNPQFYYVKNENGYLGDLEEFICLAKCKAKIISTKSIYSRYASYVGFSLYNSQMTLCLKDSDVLKDVGIVLSKREAELGMEYYRAFLSQDGEPIKYLCNHILPELRYDTAIRHPLLYCKEELISFWENYYSETAVKNQLIVIVTKENYSPYFYRKKYSLAIKYQRLGGNVVFISYGRNKQFSSDKKNVIREAYDMDGNDLGFRCCVVSRRYRIRQILSKLVDDYDSGKVLIVRDNFQDELSRIRQRICNM